jgi:hypothetical protein
MSTKAQFILALRSRKTCCAVCGSQTTDIFSQVGLQQHYRITHNAQNSMITVTIFFDFIYFKLLMYFTMNVCFNIRYWKLQDFWCWRRSWEHGVVLFKRERGSKLFGLYLDYKVPCQNNLLFSFIQSHKHNIIPKYIRWPTDLYPKCLHIMK